MKYMITVDSFYKNSLRFREENEIADKIILWCSNEYRIKLGKIDGRDTTVGHRIEFETDHIGLLIAQGIVERARKEVLHSESVRLYIMRDRIL